MTPEKIAKCFDCKRFYEETSCKAFGIKGIPEEIALGENPHDKPLPEQDNDIVFERVEDTQNE